MKLTVLAHSPAPVAAGARPCSSGFGHGYQWRNRSVDVMSINETATKRPARHLGSATT